MNRISPHLKWISIPILVLAIGAIVLTLTPSNHIGAQDDTCNPGGRYASWTITDFCNPAIDLSEIVVGVVSKDGIPAIDDPRFETIEDASVWLIDQSPVISVEIDGEAKAYPLAILTWHEIANDEVGGIPVAVTFCPLCNSAIVFDRRVDGEVLDFGVSGNLRNSDLVMYDRQTESWWQQFIGEGIVGFYSETLLDIVPSQIVSFSQFTEQFPDGQVLSRDTGRNRQYGRNPYAGYDSGNPYNSFFDNSAIDGRLPATERVLAGVIGGEAIAYPNAVLAEEIVVNDTVGGEDIVAIWQPGVASALDSANIDASRDVGTMALFSRVVDGETLTFSVDSDVIRDDQTGSTWNAFGTAVDGSLAGSQLQQLVAAPHFWFAWAAFQPDTLLYEGAS